MKLACIVGARPNFMKIAPIMRELARHPDRFEPILVHTGQHYDAKLSDVFFRELDLPRPDHHLNVGAGSQAQQTGAIMEKFDALCGEQKFDRVLVVGDVTSTLACSITAAKRCIPVDHVEAGLRSFDRTMPEEINRMVTDALADTFFVTEPSGEKNLLREGHAPEKIKLVGNVMIDSLRWHLDKALTRAKWNDFQVSRQDYLLVTLHRPSNVDDPAKLHRLVQGLKGISGRLPIIFPVHPRTRKNLETAAGAGSPQRDGTFILCEPLGYLDFLCLMAGARAVISDSGGIQEETTALGIPCLTLRNNTERPITVEIGTNTLLGEDVEALEEHLMAILEGRYKKGRVPDLWDGQASRRIVEILSAH